MLATPLLMSLILYIREMSGFEPRELLYMRKGFLIYEKMRKYLTLHEEAVSHTYMTLRPIPSKFPCI